MWRSVSRTAGETRPDGARVDARVFFWRVVALVRVGLHRFAAMPSSPRTRAPARRERPPIGDAGSRAASAAPHAVRRFAHTVSASDRDPARRAWHRFTDAPPSTIASVPSGPSSTEASFTSSFFERFHEGHIDIAAFDTARVGYTGENSVPSQLGSGPARRAKRDTVRMASFTATTRGSNSDGVTMADPAKTMTTLDRHDATQSRSQPSRTINLDGGGSPHNGQINYRNEVGEVPVPGSHDGAPNYVVATSKDKVR
jgi:hypothetical protein